MGRIDFSSGMRVVLFATGAGALALLSGALIGWFKARQSHAQFPTDSNRRRRSRIALESSVLVYGWHGDEPFSVNTATLNVSSAGALISMPEMIQPFGVVILTNLKTNEDLQCRVVWSAPRGEGKTHVGLEFKEGSPTFWQIDFTA